MGIRGTGSRGSGGGLWVKGAALPCYIMASPSFSWRSQVGDNDRCSACGRIQVPRASKQLEGWR